MKFFDVYVLPKITQAVKLGLKYCTVSFDEIMNPSVFNENNLIGVKTYIENALCIDDSMIACDLQIKDWCGGKRFTMHLTWN